MKKLIFGGLLCASCATAGAGALDGGYDDWGAWYIAGLGQYTFLDQRRVSNDHAGYQLGLGYDVAPHVALEADFSNGTFSIPGHGAREKLQTDQLDVLYKILPPQYVINPYVIAGSGLMRDNIGGHLPDNYAWMGPRRLVRRGRLRPSAWRPA